MECDYMKRQLTAQTTTTKIIARAFAQLQHKKYFLKRKSIA